MNQPHLSDAEIQLFVFERSPRGPGMHEHLNACAICRNRVASYQFLRTEIGQLPKAAFEFDVVDLVAPKIIPSHFKTSPRYPGNLLAWVFGLAALGGLGYFCRDNFQRVISGIFPLMIYLILMAALIILIFLFIEQIEKYHRQIKRINIH